MLQALRFPMIAVVLFAVAFVSVWQYLRPRPLTPSASVPTFQQRAENLDRHQLEATSASDDDTVRDHLRHAVLEGAKDFGDDPCNDAMKQHYVEAATNYARAWLSIVPCMKTGRCGSSDGKQLTLAQEAFGTPLDHRVRDAMQRVHGLGVLVRADFAPEAIELVTLLASDPVMNPRADPAIRAGTIEMRATRRQAEKRPLPYCATSAR